jgi:CDP-paratose 2-epimerase
MNQKENRSVLIFGGAGFIGSNLAYHLLTDTDAKVHVFDNLARGGVHTNIEWLRKAAGNSGRLRVTIGDVRDSRAVERAIGDATEIYHFAAQVAVTTSISEPRNDFEVNLCGTFNVLEAARKSGNHPFLLFTSTNKVYGDLGLGQPVRKQQRYIYPGHRGVSESQPLDFHSPYGCSKGASDQYVRDYARIYGLPTVVFRMSCIAGPRQFGTEDQGWVAHFLYSALRRQSVVIYGDGCQVRDVLCVKDLVRAFELVRQNLSVTAGQIYNVGGGVENTTSLLELMEQIEKRTGLEMEYELNAVRPGDQPVYITDYSRLQRDTGWKPEYNLGQTLDLIENFWEDNKKALELKPMSATANSFALATEVSGRAG